MILLAGAVRIELTSAVLETAVLTFERHPNISTRHNLIFNGALPVELLPYMAGEDGTRTHNFRLGRLNQWIAVYAFILCIYYINFFYKSQVRRLGSAIGEAAAQIHSFTLLLDNLPIVSSRSWSISIILRKSARR